MCMYACEYYFCDIIFSFIETGNRHYYLKDVMAAAAADHSDMCLSQLNCGFCCQPFEDMTDPKELPCDKSHISCRPCLEMDYNLKGGVSCPHCQ